MKKTIYYYQLLEMIQKGKQPKVVYYNHKEFTWDEDLNIYCRYDADSCNAHSLLFDRFNNVYGSYENKDFNKTIESLLPKFKVSYQEDILDETEKRYLRSVIKPFRHNVASISKKDNGYGSSYIAIDLHYPHVIGVDSMCLPYFLNSSGMYKNMKCDVKYSLQDLNL